MPRTVCLPDCADRSATCHSTCEKYLAWRKKVNDRNAAEFKKKNVEAYTVSQVIKTKTTGGTKGIKKCRPKESGKCVK